MASLISLPVFSAVPHSGPFSCPDRLFAEPGGLLNGVFSGSQKASGPGAPVGVVCRLHADGGGGGVDVGAQLATPEVPFVCVHDSDEPVQPTFRLFPVRRVVDRVAAYAVRAE